MASRYFIPGGNGQWNNTSNWSGTTGGSSGASVPLITDDVFFDSNSGTATLTVTSGAACLSFTATGSAGCTLNITTQLIVGGNITLPASGFTITGNTYLQMTATATLTTNGFTIPYFQFNQTGSAITCTLAGDLNCTNYSYANGANVTINSHTIFCTNISLNSGIVSNGTTIINMNGSVAGTITGASTSSKIFNSFVFSSSSTITCTGSWGFGGAMTSTGSSQNFSSGTILLTTGASVTANNVTFFNITIEDNLVLG